MGITEEEAQFKIDFNLTVFWCSMVFWFHPLFITMICILVKQKYFKIYISFEKKIRIMKLIFLLLFLTYFIEISKTCGGFLPVRWNYNKNIRTMQQMKNSTSSHTKTKLFFKTRTFNINFHHFKTTTT